MPLLAPSLALLLAAAPPAPESIAAGDGLVIHPKSKRAYVMDARSGVVAVDATSGRILWSSGRDAAVRPLVVVGQTLLAQLEAGEVVVLDVRDGSPFARCPGFANVRVPFPSGPPSIAQSGALSDGTTAWIAWSVTSPPDAGTTPPAQSGVLEFDVARCKAKPVKTIPFAPPTLGYGTTATPATVTLSLADDLEARVVTSDQRIRLERTKGPKALPAVELLAQPSEAAWSLTTDGAHVIVSTLVDGQEHVRVVRLADAKVLGGGALPEYPYGATLLGGILVGGNRSAFGFDVATGKLVWQRAVRSREDGRPLRP